MIIQFNFMVCRGMHQARTTPLHSNLVRKLRSRGHKANLMSGYDQLDHIQVTRVSDTDDYTSCINKTLNGIEYVKDQEFDWLMLCDDDTHVNIENLESLCESLDPETPELIGRLMNQGTGSAFIHGGTGILMSKQTAQVLHKANQEFKDDPEAKSGNSDVKLGKIVKLHNEKYDSKIGFRNNLNFVCHPYPFTDSVIAIHLKRSPFERSNIYGVK
jgi:hypothetical protein